MDKFEASEALGVSVRTLMQMIAENKINAVKKVINKKLQYVFDREEIERVKREREEGTHVAALVRQAPQAFIEKLSQPSTPALPAVLNDPLLYDALSDWRFAQVITALSQKLTLTIDEASAYSGLGKGVIRQAIEDGKIMAIAGAGHRGSMVIKRSDLESFVDGLGKGRRKS
jgi:excisionase family DNA binding protein